MNLPRGTVTFLLTDIAESARLWETDAAAMRAIAARHDALAVRLVPAHGGTLVKRRGEGEGLFAVFAHASDAVAFATEFATTVAGSFGVRMALHTGEAEIRDGDYFGRAVNRCARLRAVAHGGQILLTGATGAIVWESLPPEVALSDLGEVRLRDLDRPERVFALRHPELRADFPALRSLDSPELPNNLPPQMTSFLGREREIERIKALLQGTRLLTLSGAGGSGKTRLALQVAAELLDAFPDGAWMVELAPLADPDLVVPAVARALDVRHDPGKPCLRALTDALATKRLLLVLDNCEHVLSAGVELADALLRNCPGVTTLASSREPLGVAGEQTFRVPSLGLPDPKREDEIERSEAVRLFVERARLSRSDFALTEGNASVVAELCCQLDGIPLALELAAARLRSLSVEEVNRRLNDRFRLLTGGCRTAMPRQQTLRALIDWSYALLSPHEKLLLHRLSAFAGGWTLEAAQEVCSGPFEAWETLDLLASLVDKSLVFAEEQEGDVRYGLLETVRQYARDRLLESGEAETIRHRHRDAFLALAEAIQALGDGPEQAAGFARLEREHDNLRSALEWCRTTEEGAGCGLRMVAALWPFWNVRGHAVEGLAWILEITGWEGAQGMSEARAHALNGAGILAIGRGDLALAHRVLEESLAVWRGLESPAIVHTLASLAYLAATRDDPAAERAHNEEALRRARASGDRRFTLYPLRGLGEWALKQGDPERAEAYLQESVAVGREFGDLKGLVWSLNALAELRAVQGDRRAVAALQAEATEIAARLNDSKGMIVVVAYQAQSTLAHGEYATARALFGQVLRSVRETDDAMTAYFARYRLATVAQYLGEFDEARRAFDELRPQAAESEIMVAHLLSESAWHAWWRGDMRAGAMRMAQEEAALRLGHLEREDLLPRVRCHLAWALAADGCPERAERLFRKVLATLPDHPRHDLAVWCLEGLARALARQERWESAAEMLGGAEAIRKGIGYVLPPQVRSEREGFVASVRDSLGSAFGDLFAQGLARKPDAVVAWALEEPSVPQPVGV